MRALLLSDIHSNSEALDACLKAAPQHDVILNLGDIVGYGASPNEVVDRVREIGKIFVRGNHDKVCAGIEDVRGFNPIAAAAAMWTHHELTPSNLAWLKELPSGPLPIESLEGVRIVHGSPRDEDEYLLAAEDAAMSAVHDPVPVTFFGHTHIQGAFRVERSREVTTRPEFSDGDGLVQWELKLEPEGSYLINPGSVGQPRDGDWRAAFALYDEETYAITFYRVTYDIAAAQKRIRDARLPERLAARLSEGR